jgi:methyl-accepting chemotaxis protein
MNALGFKKTIMVAMIILVSLCLIISNWIAYLALKTNTVEQVQRNSTTIVKYEADAIAKWFEAKANAVSSMADQYRQGGIKDQYVSVSRLVKQSSDLYSVFWGFEDGSSYASVENDDIWQDGVADPEQYDPRPRGWYQLAMQNSHAVLTDIYTDLVTGKPVISIVTNLGDGVLSGDIGLGILNNTVEQINYPGALTAIIDQSGKALASTSPKFQVGQNLNEIGLGELKNNITSSSSYQGEYMIDGTNKLTFSKAIPLLGGQQWYLLVRIDTDVAYAQIDKALQQAVITSIVMLLISIILVLIILHWLYQPIIQLKAVIQSLSQGQADLTMRLPVKSHDDLGAIAKGVNHFISNLEGLIKEVLQSSVAIGGSIEQLKYQTAENSTVLNRHVQETEQVVAAIEEMSATANDVANNTSQASQASNSTSKHVNDTKSMVTGTHLTVERLIADVESTEINITNIEQDAVSITKVLQVIGEIADQTNLLALNAAIEAARAGEQGRGFAVVADEVRTLAARTQSSTAEIESTLDKLQQGIDAAVGAMKQTKQTCQQTSSATNDVTRNLDDVVLSVAQVSDLNTQIATAAEEQSVVSVEISRNMATIREMITTLYTNGNASNIENEKLSLANDKLMAVVGKFTIK